MTESRQPLGMSDFFAREAGEYLERLDGLLAKGSSPSADEIVRLARALRGSALMASQPAIARTAAGLEAVARAVREGRRAWDPQTQQLALRGVDDLKIFVRRAGSWTEADTAKAEALAPQLEPLSGSGLEPPANVGELFQVAGSAIARAAREVAERGRPDADGADFRQFAGLLVKFMESEPDAVSIGSLYYSDSGPHIVQRGVPAARPSTLGKLELVSHGEHLRQAADSLERAPSATQRELRAHTLGSTFRALANAGGGVLADRAAHFAAAAREAVASGIAVSSPAAFAAELRRAGDLLARSSTGDEEALATELDALTAALRGIQPGAPAAAPPLSPAPRPAPPPPPRAAPVVPVERAAPPPAPARTPAPQVEQVISETPDLVGSWAAYQRLAEGGIGAASLAELIG